MIRYRSEGFEIGSGKQQFITEDSQNQKQGAELYKVPSQRKIRQFLSSFYYTVLI
jgi:hypothetical protein